MTHEAQYILDLESRNYETKKIREIIKQIVEE